MSRAHALAPSPGPSSSIARSGGPKTASRGSRSAPDESCYVKRALLLWPRLERAKLRKVGEDPTRIAELVVRRTSQPFEAVLAMLMRQNPALEPQIDDPLGFEIIEPKQSRVALRIVRSDEGSEIRFQTIAPH